MVLKRKDFEDALESYAWRLLAEVSLSEDRLQEVKAYVFEASCLVESKEEETDGEAAVGAPSKPPPPVADSAFMVFPSLMQIPTPHHPKDHWLSTTSPSRVILALHHRLSDQILR